MTLPDDLEEAFRGDVHEFEEEKKVRYVTSIERLGFRDGMEEGERKTLLEWITAELEERFGTPCRRLMRKVRTLDDVAKLRQFLSVLKKAAALEEVREHLG